jgi:flagellar motility protein MotE (MotC chaperone)
MKKALIAVGVSFAFFAVGLVAMYFAMPAIAPELVETVQQRLDSLMMPPPELTMAADSLMRPPLRTDSTAAQPVYPPMTDVLVGLRDSLQRLQRSIDEENEEKAMLLRRVEQIEQRWSSLEVKYDEASQMSNTITKMEDKELADLLSRLEDDVLESLYVEASARNRARLLQMLPAEKAATLVDKLTDPSNTFTSDSDPDRDPTNQ